MRDDSGQLNFDENELEDETEKRILRMFNL